MYSIEKKDGVLEVNIKFPVNFLMDYCFKVYEKNETNYEVEGYKKGEAPMEEVLNKYGEEVLKEAQSMALTEVMFSILKENPEINHTSEPKIELVDNDGNFCSFKITMPYIGIKLGQYKGLKIICGGKFVATVEDSFREMVERSIIHLSMNELYDKIIETSEFEFPQSLIDEQKNILLAEKQSKILAHGSTMEEYLEDECLTPEQFETSLRRESIHTLSKKYLILKLCEIERISATDIEVDEKIKQLALNENDTFENVKSKLSNQELIIIKHIIESDRAYDFLVNNNKFIFNEK